MNKSRVNRFCFSFIYFYFILYLVYFSGTVETLIIETRAAKAFDIIQIQPNLQLCSVISAKIDNKNTNYFFSDLFPDIYNLLGDI